ncbi:unnamed protein product [Rhizoctonia solani]|uniref:Complex 1 LYR-like protein n=1 Tax=Rhizoctonia solani AG-3 Rhs1AP TaxID=1086054 RepID=X8JJ12_9AGAM|nr:complex 1 LYR-like protein [Rhizoctonia solani AG-3 Rhs1AP]CAE6454087.1 unnamed protein product [Rhizoctonia solani]
MGSTSRSQVLSLYRSLLREAHKLPDPLVKFTYSTYIRDRFRKNARISGESLLYQKVKTAKQKLRQLEAANSGDKTAVARALRFAYGVTGPVRHQNLLTYKRTGDSPGTADTRPPPFPPALKALLASPLARMKPGSKNQPDEPVALSLALDKRGWLGKLPERRERNLWWNWWREEPAKTLVPTEIEVIEPNLNTSSTSSLESTDLVENSDDQSAKTSTPLRLRQLGLPIVSTQDSGLLRRAEEYSRSHVIPKDPRRYTKRTVGSPDQILEATMTVPPQSRFMRRRYRELLSKMPILSFKPTSSSQAPHIGISGSASHDQNPRLVSPVPPGKFSVSMSPHAATLGPRSRTTYSIMTQEDRQWIERAREFKQTSVPKSGESRLSKR